MGDFLQGLKELNKLRQHAKVLEKQLRDHRLEFSSRDGRIKGVINGKMEVLSLEVSPDLLVPAQKQTLERLLMTSLNSAVGQMQGQVSRMVGSQMGINLPDLGL